MTLDENDEKIDLDFHYMHSQLVKEKRNYREQENLVLMGAKALEKSLTDTLKSIIKKNKGKTETGTPKLRSSVSVKLKWLLSNGIISEQFYQNMSLIFGIRNKFAHKFMMTVSDTIGIYDSLGESKVDNEFVENLPNDVVKFWLVVSYCFTELFYISKKIDPSSILDLGVVEEMTPLED